MSSSRCLDLELLPETLAVLRLPADAAVPDDLPGSGFVSTTRTDTELSVVCRESPELPGEVERGWRCLRVAGPLEFDQIGVLSALAAPLRDAGVSIFVISTYDTDYLLVRNGQLETARTALRAAGHRVL